MKKFSIKDLPKLIVSILVPLVIGFIGGIATSASIPNWYVTLNKPFFTPPNWLFGPVWTTLYILMGISFFLVWREGFKKESSRTAAILYTVQLFVNLFWSIIFFGFKSLAGGLIVIIVLWVLILMTLLNFYKISKTAGYLLVPYIIWVSIASALNLAVVILNM